MGKGDVKIFGLTDFPIFRISKKITQPLCLCVIFGCTSNIIHINLAAVFGLHKNCSLSIVIVHFK